MTTYLNFTPSAETSEIGGHYPQIEGFKKGYVDDAPTSIFNIQELEENNDYHIDIPDFILSKTSKLTDFLSFNRNFFIISPRAMSLIGEFSLPPHKKFNCFVRHGEKKHPYCMLYLFRNEYDFTDYKKSKFIMRYFSGKEHYEAILQSQSSFLKEAKGAHQILTDIIYVRKNAQLHFDIFKINRYQPDYFLSEKLQEVLVANRITGIDYLENVDTVFTPQQEAIIIEKRVRFKQYFLNRAAWYSNGIMCRQFNADTKVIEEFTRTGKKTREMILFRGDFKGSERTYFSTGNVRVEKIIKGTQEQRFKYYFQNGKLNYEIIYHGETVVCDNVFDVNGKKLKGYGLKNGTGKIIHFNTNGKGGEELTFKNHDLIKERKLAK